MAITAITGPNQNAVIQALPSGKRDSETALAASTSTSSVGDAAVYEKTSETAGAAPAYTKDTATLSEISSRIDAKLMYLRTTVEKLITQQGLATGNQQGLTYEQIMQQYDGRLKEFYQQLPVDQETSEQARADTDEDGFWGVKKTAERALSFAKALVGGDVTQVDALKAAITEGYKAAEAAWGDELPDICQQTQAAILQGLDEWAAQRDQVSTADNAATSASHVTADTSV